MKHLNLFLIGIFLISMSKVSWAQSLPKASTIVLNTNKRDDGKVLTRNITLELIDKRGKKKTQITKSYRKYFGEEKRQSFFYQSPTNLKGTAFLTFDYSEQNKDDDRWLYLPALRKTRRISGAEKGGYFLGTDFTYEDVNLGGKLSKNDYNYSVIGIENIDGHKCYVLEGVPKTDKIKKELKYSKIKSWVDAEIWMVRKGEYWDIQGNHLKTIHSSNIQKVNSIWTTHIIHVKNHKTKHQTYLRSSNIDYKSAIEDDVFTEEALVNGI